jgi:hypothetical protein
MTIISFHQHTLRAGVPEHFGERKMKILICADMFPAMIETVTRQSFDALGQAVAENIKRLKKGLPLQNLAVF